MGVHWGMVSGPNFNMQLIVIMWLQLIVISAEETVQGTSNMVPDAISDQLQFTSWPWNLPISVGTTDGPRKEHNEGI